jgi:hypothetical protein
MSKTIMIILLIAIVYTPLKSQEQQNRFTVDLKGGFSVPLKYESGIMLGTDLSLFRGNRLYSVYSVGYAYMEEFTFGTNSKYVNQQLEFLTGKQLNLKYAALQIMGGIGPVWGNLLTTSGMENFFTPGLFLKAGWRFIPFKYVGLGTDLELNLNAKNPVLLITLGLSFGRQHFFSVHYR